MVSLVESEVVTAFEFGPLGESVGGRNPAEAYAYIFGLRDLLRSEVNENSFLESKAFVEAGGEVSFKYPFVDSQQGGGSVNGGPYVRGVYDVKVEKVYRRREGVKARLELY